MKNIFLFSFLPVGVLTFFFTSGGFIDNLTGTEIITFYEVPLVCGAAPEIACGSRVKPLFIDTEKISGIKKSWVNRQGTVISFVWDESMNDETKRENIVQPLFKKHTIEARLIKDEKRLSELTASLQGKGKWYEGMDVDQLSIEESGVIAGSFVEEAENQGIINKDEAVEIKTAIEEYFRKDLVKVRTYASLKSEETQNKWFSDLYDIVIDKVGKEKADKIVELYVGKDNKKEDCCEEDKKAESCCK